MIQVDYMLISFIKPYDKVRPRMICSHVVFNALVPILFCNHAPHQNFKRLKTTVNV